MYQLSKCLHPQRYWNLLYLIHKNRIMEDIMVIRGPIKTEQLDFFRQKVKNRKIIGISSYSTFPDSSGYFHNHYYLNFLSDYDSQIIGWFHCFREPFQNIPDSSIPLFFMSESDFHTDFEYLSSLHSIHKEYDFVANIPEGDWNSFVRDLKTAQKWLNFMADEMGLKILVIGKNRKKDFSQNVHVLEDFLPQQDFWKVMSTCKALFIASVYDASPRIITEALGLNLSVLCNKNIVGGWKYIQSDTGMFFDPEENISFRIDSFLQHHYEPNKYAKTFLDQKKNLLLFSHQLEELFHRTFDLDAILFINLENRKDRLLSIESQCRKMNIKTAIRIEGVYENMNGHLGCGLSHIKALEYAKERNWKRFMILEDDFIFKYYKERILSMYHLFLENIPCWDVFLLDFDEAVFDKDPVDAYPFIKKIDSCTRTTGYIVNDYTDNLLENFREAVLSMKNEMNGKKIYYTNYAIDQSWKQLQKKDKFFGTIPKIGKNNNSPSSIMS